MQAVPRTRAGAPAPAGTSAREFLPERITLPALRAAVRGCRGCPLYARATQGVFGEGRARARALLVGEQPGHEEDLAGRPFAGPAGRVLARALAAAGIARSDTYVTNVVKHFKWGHRERRRPRQASCTQKSPRACPGCRAKSTWCGPTSSSRSARPRRRRCSAAASA